MKIIILLSSIALVSASQNNPPPRSVNVALETSFLFDPKDIKDNKYLVNNIKGFLDKLYKMLEPTKKDKHNRAESNPKETGAHNRVDSKPLEEEGHKSADSKPLEKEGHKSADSKPLEKEGHKSADSKPLEKEGHKSAHSKQQEMEGHKSADSKPQEKEGHKSADSKPQEAEGGADFIEILRTIGSHFVNMPGEKVKEAVNIIHDVVTKVGDNRKSQGEIKEVLQEDNIKSMIRYSIIEWLKSNPEDMKKMINTTITDDSPLLKTFARRMNSYYNYEDVKHLNKILKKFKRNIDNDVDNTKIIKEILNNAIFKKYNSLNESAKTALLSDVKVLSGFLVAKNMYSGLKENISVLSRRNSPIIEQYDTADFHKNDDMTYAVLRRSIDQQLKDARVKKTRSEIVFDNVEVFVEPPKNP